jgi:hypothetical protein
VFQTGTMGFALIAAVMHARVHISRLASLGVFRKVLAASALTRERDTVTLHISLAGAERLSSNPVGRRSGLLSLSVTRTCRL